MLALTLRYAAFAVLATGANLGAQRLCELVYQGPFALMAAMILGTGCGLVSKYLLDKRWIFRDSSRGVAAHSRRFSLYTGTGIFTTLLFWGTEYGFDRLPPAGEWRYLGAVIGLSIGYVVKYHLDRRFVFPAQLAATPPALSPEA